MQIMLKNKKPIGSAILIFLIGFILSSASAWLLLESEKKRLDSNFKLLINDYEQSINRQLNINKQAIKSIAVLFRWNDQLNYQAFKIESDKIIKEFPDTQAIEWIPKITHQNKSRYLAHIREFYPEYEIKQLDGDTKGEVQYPVLYLNPIKGNEHVFGVDLFSNERRRKDIIAFTHSDQPVFVRSIELIQGKKGIIIILPVFKNTDSTNSRAIKGIVSGVYKIHKMLTTAQSSSMLKTVPLRIVEDNKDTVLFSQNLDNQDVNKRHKIIVPIKNDLNLRWSIIAYPQHSLFSNDKIYSAWIIFIAGIICSLAIASYILFMIQKSILIQTVVERKTKELHKANQELLNLSNMDALTGLANRRSLNQFFNNWEKQQDDNLNVSVLIMDIDYFKLYNDYYGHTQGDKCLKQVAEKLKVCGKRKNDLVARFGGEEFIAILSECSNPSSFAELCRMSIEALGIPHAASSVAKHVTISIGVSTGIPTNIQELKSMIDTADKALYEAKEKGRNQTIEKVAIDFNLQA